jgi:catechol 2,3-dioxygenase-like lactoylglutathione lyase family enzyme
VLDHVSITVSNIDRAEAFYDAVFAALGFPKVVSEPNRLGYGERARPDHPDRTYLSIRVGEAGRLQGRHWAFKAKSRSAVDAFHAEGLAAGGRDEGPPGPEAALSRELLRGLPARSGRKPDRGGVSRTGVTRDYAAPFCSI